MMKHYIDICDDGDYVVVDYDDDDDDDDDVDDDYDKIING